MRIVVPVTGNRVEEHFGRCKSFAIYTVDKNNVITHKQILPWDEGCGCRSNAAGIFKEKGVSIALVGGLGNGALAHLQANGILVYRGAGGNADELVSEFIKGNIEDSGKNCGHHHEHSYECNHHH